jgi:hypothetical protein
MTNLTPTTKNQESPWFTYMKVTCNILLESSQWGLQLCFILYLNQRFVQKVMGLQNCKNPNFKNFETHNLGVLGQNDIWALAPGQAQRIIEGGRWWLPPSMGCGESCKYVFACGSSMHQKCSNYSLTNLLFGLCRSMRIIDLLVTRFSPHPRALTRPSSPEVLWAKERALTLYPSVVFTFELIVESIKMFGGVLDVPQNMATPLVEGITLKEMASVLVPGVKTIKPTPPSLKVGSNGQGVDTPEQ